MILSALALFVLASCSSDEPDAPKGKYDYGDRVENVWNPDYGFIPEDYAYAGSLEKIFERLRLPDEFLNSLSTMELTRVCLSFPYIYDIMFGETVYQMSDMMQYRIDSFRGFELLRQRKDAFDCMLDYYEGLIHEIEKTKGKHDFTIIQLPVCEFFIGSGHLRSIDELPQCERLEQLAIRAVNIRNNYERYQGCTSMCGLYWILTVCGFDFDFGPSYHW